MDLLEPFRLLGQLDSAAFLTMFWYLVVVELPRYTLSFVVVGTVIVLGFRKRQPPRTLLEEHTFRNYKLSAVIAGHNEADAMRKCIRSLAEQTRKFDEIIVVDDGSTDGMRELLHALRAEGLIDVALCNQVRCGKSSACNLGFALATGDIVINLDADCSYDRNAIEQLIEPFRDPLVGATCGNIGVRNAKESVASSFQAVEYIVSISLGKRVLDYFDLVVCASGAFGAFKREAMAQVGGLAIGPGEDLDLTMRLRRSGWRIRFVADSWCMTDTPSTFPALIRQRRRWDRDTLRVRLRKFRSSFLANIHMFRPLETAEQIEFLLLNFFVTMIFPIYIGWLCFEMGSYAAVVLLAVSLIYIILDLISFMIAALVCRRFEISDYISLIPFVLTFGIYGLFSRCVRLYAYIEELIFYASYKDSYVPSRILNIGDRY